SADLGGCDQLVPVHLPCAGADLPQSPERRVGAQVGRTFSQPSARYHSMVSRYPSASDFAGRKSNCVASLLAETAHPVAVASRILSKLTIPGLPRHRAESSPTAAADVSAQRRTLTTRTWRPRAPAISRPTPS